MSCRCHFWTYRAFRPSQRKRPEIDRTEMDKCAIIAAGMITSLQRESIRSCSWSISHVRPFHSIYGHLRSQTHPHFPIHVMTRRSAPTRHSPAFPILPYPPPSVRSSRSPSNPESTTFFQSIHRTGDRRERETRFTYHLTLT